MGIIKVLKRKDGASLVVGLALGIIVSNFVSTVTVQLTNKLSNIGSGVASQQLGDGWRNSYLQPAVALILQVVALELLIWVYVLVHNALNNK